MSWGYKNVIILIKTETKIKMHYLIVNEPQLKISKTWEISKTADICISSFLYSIFIRVFSSVIYGSPIQFFILSEYFFLFRVFPLNCLLWVRCYTKTFERQQSKRQHDKYVALKPRAILFFVMKKEVYKIIFSLRLSAK